VNDDRVYLEHIRDALDDIATYTNVGRDAFFADRMRQDATFRKLEVVGQAVKNLSEETKLRQPHIPWKQIAGMRDKIIHRFPERMADYGNATSRRSSGSNARRRGYAWRASRCSSRRSPRELTR
jgi:uncharacterized protein with HEPN domain